MDTLLDLSNLTECKEESMGRKIFQDGWTKLASQIQLSSRSLSSSYPFGTLDINAVS